MAAWMMCRDEEAVGHPSHQVPMLLISFYLFLFLQSDRR